MLDDKAGKKRNITVLDHDVPVLAEAGTTLLCPKHDIPPLHKRVAMKKRNLNMKAVDALFEPCGHEIQREQAQLRRARASVAAG